jgi:hypothetical protein
VFSARSCGSGADSVFEIVSKKFVTKGLSEIAAMASAAINFTAPEAKVSTSCSRLLWSHQLVQVFL